MNFERMTIAELSAYLEVRESLHPDEEELLKKDPRRGVAILLERFYRRLEARLQESKRLHKMLSLERELWQSGFKQVAGVDEAGRGPLAGPVVAAAVILKPDVKISLLNDSKQLSSATREMLFEKIIINALGYAIGSASREEIDRINIHAASMLAMRRALEALPVEPDYVLVDGFQLKECPFKQKAIKNGDFLSQSIAAASILAKVTRDKIMAGLHRQYPAYGFERNMGYGTEEHRRALSRYGPCPAHRRSFRLNY